MSAPALRPYQHEAAAAVLVGRERGVMRQLVSIPTGCGKTIVLSAIPPLLGLRSNDVTLVIAHRDELIKQTVRKVKAADPHVFVQIEQDKQRAKTMRPMYHSDKGGFVIVASIASLKEKRLLDFMQRFTSRIAVLIIDECHHSSSATYLQLIEAVMGAREDALLVGFTATPQRSDNVGLSLVFSEVVYHKNVKWAVSEGWLVPIKCYRVKTHTSLDGVTTVAGDYKKNELAQAVNTMERNESIVSAYIEHIPGKKAIAFCVNVAHAIELARVFNEAGVPAGFVHGGTPKDEREAIFDKVKTGEIKVLTNCGIAIEGYDEPSIEAVIAARPTQSNLLFTQMVGRGLRPLDEVAGMLGTIATAAERRALIGASRKPEAVILDVVDQSAKRSIVTLPSLWGLPPKIDPQGKRVDEILEQYEELASKDPAAADQVELFSQIKTLIEAVDLFSIPEMPAEVKDFTRMAWVFIGEDHYRIHLPTRTVAKDREGNVIPDFARRFKDAMQRAEVRKMLSPRKVALDELNAMPESVEETKESVEIRPDPLNRIDVVLHSNGSERMLGSVEFVPEAFKRAEAFITNNRPAARATLVVDQPWRSMPPTDGQIAALRQLGCPDDKIPRTKGLASTMVRVLIERKNEKRAATKTPAPV